MPAPARGGASHAPQCSQATVIANGAVVDGWPRLSDMRIRYLVLWLAAAACGAEQPASELAQIGGLAIPASGVRVAAEPPPWSTIAERLAGLGSGGSTVIEFVPQEGFYDVQDQPIEQHDSCGVGKGSLEIDHEISAVKAKYATYRDTLLARNVEDEFDEMFTVGCELHDHTFRCDSSRTTIDFTRLGLDAEV